MAINKKKICIFIGLILFFYNSPSKSVTNNVIATIDNSIITELDLKKEIEYIKFINKSEIDNNFTLSSSRVKGWYSSLYGYKEPAEQIMFSTNGKYIKTTVSIKK